jgi:DNA-binding transcriptional MerR regulator
MPRHISGLFHETDEAKRLGISLRTLRFWRRQGYGPVPTYVGRFVYYTPQAHADFLVSGARPVPVPMKIRRAALRAQQQETARPRSPNRDSGPPLPVIAASADSH